MGRNDGPDEKGIFRFPFELLSSLNFLGSWLISDFHKVIDTIFLANIMGIMYDNRDLDTLSRMANLLKLLT